MKVDPELATRLLERVESGDLEAQAQLLPMVYEELRLIANGYLRGERQGHTLQPTALVHEAWMRLIGGSGPPETRDRGHFVALGAKAMRNVLVDHHRARGALKRNAGGERLALDQVTAFVEEHGFDLVGLDEALEQLESFDPELGRLVELRYFAGLTIEQTASVLEVSTPTVERHWRIARMWLRERLPGLR
jgi:RNA polymerase sigma factor (TIGR02999 family)